MLKFKKSSAFLALLVVVSAILFNACKKEENAQTTLTDDQKLERTQELVKASQFFTNAFSKSTFATEKANGLREDEPVLQVRGLCGDPTVTPANPLTFPKTVTLDYGTGCTDDEGRNRSGKMTLDVGKFWEQNSVIKANFTNFTEERSKLNGSYTITNSNILGAQNLTFVADNIVYTDENGKTTAYTIRQTHKQTDGMRTPLNPRDDVYEVTSSMTSTMPDGTKSSWESTTPLIKANNCRWIQKGKVTVKMNNETSVLDYGNGTCDDDATITTNGVVRNIKL
jgi:hypothetical protein